METISIAIDKKKIGAELSVQAERKYRELGEQLLRELFARKNRHGYPGQEDGEGTKFIKDIIDDLLLDDNITAKIRKYIEKHFDTILEEACIDAMRHKAKAVAFQTDIKVPACGFHTTP